MEFPGDLKNSVQTAIGKTVDVILLCKYKTTLKDSHTW